MARFYYIDEHSHDVIETMRGQVLGAVRPRSDGRLKNWPSMPQDIGSDFLCLATITGTGHDSKHWKWANALRHALDGTVVAGGITGQNYPGDSDVPYSLGQCVMYAGLQGYVGLNGAIYLQLGDDGKLNLTFVPFDRQILVRITSHTGSGPLNWNPYASVCVADGTTVLSIYNGFEDNGSSSTCIEGAPGSLGVNVSSTGLVNGGTCYVQPIGAAAVWVGWDPTNKRWTFSASNSAQVP